MFAGHQAFQGPWVLHLVTELEVRTVFLLLSSKVKSCGKHALENPVSGRDWQTRRGCVLMMLRNSQPPPLPSSLAAKKASDKCYPWSPYICIIFFLILPPFLCYYFPLPSLHEFLS